MLFVWWQVFLIGIPWVRAIEANDVCFRRINQNIQRGGRAGYSPVPGEATFRADAASIHRIIAYFQNHFAATNRLAGEAEMVQILDGYQAVRPLATYAPQRGQCPGLGPFAITKDV